MVADSDERHFLLVQVEVKDLERFVSLFWKACFIHEHNAVDGQGNPLHLVATLTVDGTGEHSLDLIGRRAA